MKLSTLVRLAGLAVPLYAAHVGIERTMPLGTGVQLNAATRVVGTTSILRLTHNRSHIACWVQLTFQSDSDFDDIDAAIAVAATPLDAHVSMRRAPLVEVDIRPQGARAHSVYFEWPAGYAVEIKRQGDLALRDWAVWQQDAGAGHDQPDTMAKAQTRRGLDILFIVLFIIATLHSIYEAWTAPESSAGQRGYDSAKEVIASLIDAVSGDSHSETRRMQKFLRQVLLKGTPIPQAERILKPYSQRIQVKRRAIQGLRHELLKFKSSVSMYESILAGRSS